MRWHLTLLPLTCLLATASRADGPTALQLQSQLAAGSNGGVGQFTSITGDASATTVRPAGASTSRSLAVRLSEQINVRDYGASCDGATDDTAAVQAARMAGQGRGTGKQGRGTGKIVIPAGCSLKLNTNIFTVNTNAWDWEAGSYVVGGSVQGDLDQTQRNMQSLSKASAYAGNENGLAIYDLYDPVAGNVSYQKNGLYVRTFQVDPSTYSNPQTITYNHDVVGIESQAGILQNNPTGRAWAYHGACGVYTGSEGQCISGEFEIYNYASYEPLGGRFDSKVGLHVTAMGSQDSTIGIVIAGAQHWETGIAFLQGSLRPDGMAWEMAAPNGSLVASMSYNGTIATNGKFLSSFGKELTPTHPGVAAGRYYFGVSPGGSGTPLSSLASQIAWTPFKNPATTQYGKIGVSITTAAPDAKCFMNVYASKDGVPTGSPLLGTTPVIQETSAGDSEATISLTLPGGLYFSGIACTSNSVGVSTYTENDAVGLIGTSSSSSNDTTVWSAFPGYFTVSPSITYGSNNNQMVKIWLRR